MFSLESFLHLLILFMNALPRGEYGGYGTHGSPSTLWAPGFERKPAGFAVTADRLPALGPVLSSLLVI